MDKIAPLPPPAPKLVKAFLEYPSLVQLLERRGMYIGDHSRCERKLAQVGYYRLSGYWHSARAFTRVGRDITHHSEFQPQTSFEDVFNFYLFDKCVRQEFISALERIEIYFRTIIAHEIGRENPLAYKDKRLFTRNAFDSNKKGPNYSDWDARHEQMLKESKEDSITSHIRAQKPIPIWVAAEAWDFGTLAKFYSMLKEPFKDKICTRVGVDNRDVLDNWLINLNGIRNRCAHHSRLCNRPSPRTFMLPRNGYFNLLALSQNECEKLFGSIAVIWFLIKKIGPSSNWLFRMADLIDKKPSVPGFFFSSMGFSKDATAFPRDRFTETKAALSTKIPASEQPMVSLPKEDELLSQLEAIAGIHPPTENSLRFSDRLLSLSCYFEEQEKTQSKT
ncbi:TPA: Abi family protein [Yersinia enterocolitica]|nr:Abi family protein [Yersinia enterocolitica]HEM8996443.1 Abi family protein [Yersinia enterocolitica]HEO8480192.1 Abi family protein [Yersinia enterocolitica]